MNLAMSLRLTLGLPACVLALAAAADTHPVLNQQGKYDSNWQAYGQLRTYPIETYKVVDPVNPDPDEYPYDDQGIMLMAFNYGTTQYLLTPDGLPGGLSKLSLKYCLGDYQNDPGYLVISVKPDKNTPDSEAEVFEIYVDESSLFFAPNGRPNNRYDYYCMPHLWEHEFALPAGACVNITSRPDKRDDYEIIVWDLEWSDYEGGEAGPVKPDNAGSWHSGYGNILDLDSPAGAFDGFDFAELAPGESRQLSDAVYRFPLLDAAAGPIVMNVSGATLSALADGTYALDLNEGDCLEVVGKLGDEEYSQLQHIIVRHDIDEAAAFDDGELLDEPGSLTHWQQPAPADPAAPQPMAMDEEGRIVRLTAVRPVRVYGVAVAQPLVVTSASITVDDGDDSPARLYDLRGIAISRPLPGQLYISVDARGTARLHRN